MSSQISREAEVDRLIGQGEYVSPKFPSTREIFDVINPLFQETCLEIAKNDGESPFFRLPHPFGTSLITDTLYERWGERDRYRHKLEWGGEITDWRMHLDSGNIPLVYLEGRKGQINPTYKGLSSVGKFLLVAGGLDEAAFLRSLEIYHLKPEEQEKCLPGITDFYNQRVTTLARLGALGPNPSRMIRERPDLVVHIFNELPHELKMDGLRRVVDQ